MGCFHVAVVKVESSKSGYFKAESSKSGYFLSSSYWEWMIALPDHMYHIIQVAYKEFSTVQFVTNYEVLKLPLQAV